MEQAVSNNSAKKRLAIPSAWELSKGAVTEDQMNRLIRANHEATLSPETRRILTQLIIELQIMEVS